MSPPFPTGGFPPARSALPPPRDVDAHTRAVQAPSTAMIVASEVDPRADLARERASSTFPARELAALLAGGEDKLVLREKVGDAVRAHPVFSKKGKYFMERADLYRTTLEKYLALPALAAELGARGVGDPMAIGRVIREMIDEPGGLDLHLGMFIPTIQGQADEEQKKYWMPRCIKLRVIGTYAQTELGHGTYIRGLETTATYDPSTEQFVIHSPTLTSTKWWPGGMGKTATHAIVMARLITHRGEDKGPHAFVVQIRANENHATMPGVTAGDIGPKMGYNAVDNGYLRFDHVRVPRRAMLMKHAAMSKDGTYTPPPVAKAAYGTMVFVRSDIVMNASLYMKKAAVIATRYNLVRRQSNPGSAPNSAVFAKEPTTTAHLKDKKLELQVMDYQHSQRSLFPVLARAFAFHCASDYMRRMYFEYEKRSREDADFSALPELHATSSGLKAYCSWATKDAIELCRLCCGGQGFMALAGFGSTFGNYAPNATYEGDNNVLCLQTARYLLKVRRAAALVAREEAHTQAAVSSTLDEARAKAARETVQAAANGAARYLLEPQSRSSASGAGWRGGRDPDAMLAAYAHVARRLVSAAAERAGSRSADAAMQSDMVAWIKAAKAHCAYVVLKTFKEAVEEVREKRWVSRSTQRAMERLVALHGLATADDAMGDFLEDGYVDGAGAEAIRTEISALLLELRPDAAALTDAFALDDYFLNSALGAADGDVYARLYAEVQEAPFNASHTPPGYETLLRQRLLKGVEGSSKL